jgi:hypothetical protein
VTLHQPPPAQPEFEPESDSQSPTRGRRMLILAGCAVLGTVIGIAAQVITGGAPAPTTALRSTPKPTALAQLTITSFDPKKDGTGFRKDGDSWRTERYASATFGNYKPGVGLVLDLGSARALSAVTLDAVTGPLTVELRTGDNPPTSASSLARVGAAAQATGATTLPATAGGSHRYWMIWVTGLASADGGFRAVIRTPSARATG